MNFLLGWSGGGAAVSEAVCSCCSAGAVGLRGCYAGGRTRRGNWCRLSGGLAWRLSQASYLCLKQGCWVRSPEPGTAYHWTNIGITVELELHLGAEARAGRVATLHSPFWSAEAAQWLSSQVSGCGSAYSDGAIALPICGVKQSNRVVDGLAAPPSCRMFLLTPWTNGKATAKEQWPCWFSFWPGVSPSMPVAVRDCTSELQASLSLRASSSSSSRTLASAASARARSCWKVAIC